jgi:hypothetical protein
MTDDWKGKFENQILKEKKSEKIVREGYSSCLQPLIDCETREVTTASLTVRVHACNSMVRQVHEDWETPEENLYRGSDGGCICEDIYAKHSRLPVF